MAYTKQTWANGDTITAEKLNHMESGIEEGAEEYPGYDLVIICSKQPGDEATVSDLTIAKGSFEACEEKIAAGKGIRAALYCLFIYGEGSTINSYNAYELISYEVGYRYLKFTEAGQEITYWACQLEYETDYSISGFAFLD